MRNARSSLTFLGLLAWLLVPTLASAEMGAWGPLADGSLIRARQHVPDDPLAGLPPENGGRPSRSSRGGKAAAAKTAATCSVDGRPANPRDIGDLRATLAVVQRGPKIVACPAQSLDATIGLRITVDGAGKITAAEPLGAAAEVAAAMAKRLSGKSIAARRDGATTGTVWLVFTPKRTRQ
jgi:hypothetical protein